MFLFLAFLLFFSSLIELLSITLAVARGIMMVVLILFILLFCGEGGKRLGTVGIRFVQMSLLS